MNELADRLKKEFSDKEYRHAYVDEFLNSYIATQIKVLREQRGWNQEKLAQEAGMKQSRISVLEDVNYYSWSLSTLKRLAKAFDVPLNVSFGTFGDRLIDIKTFSREWLERCAFDEDPVFHEEKEDIPISSAISATLADQERKSKQDNILFLDQCHAQKPEGALSMMHPTQGSPSPTLDRSFPTPSAQAR